MLATFTRDFGYGYVAAWHRDVDDLQAFYLDNPRQTLFVAIEQQTGAVVATTGVRTGGPRAPAHPDWLVARYAAERTAELVRVYVDPAHRRRGLAQSLVALASSWIGDEGGYEVIIYTPMPIHPAQPRSGRALPTVEVYAKPERKQVQGHWLRTIHFELAMPPKAEGMRDGE